MQHERAPAPLAPRRGAPAVGARVETRPGAPMPTPAPAVDELLSGLVGELGLTGAQWLPGRGDPIGDRPGFRPADVDWDLVERLAPGEVRVVGAATRRRRPRLAAADGNEVLAAASEGRAAGVLRLQAPGTTGLDRDALVEVADLVARSAHAAEDEKRIAIERREIAMGRRVATLAHDLRNQLTLALCGLERLRDASDIADALDGIDGLEGVLAAARDLCAANLSEGDGAPPAARRLVLRAVLVEEARAASSLARRGRDVRMRVRCPASLAVHVELASLARLVRNLLANAVDASVDGGDVRVEAVPLEDGRVELVVSDDGRGMDADGLESMFRPGVSDGGTGYGTQSLFESVERLGAELWVETALGLGTRVRVTLPGSPAEDVPGVLVIDPDDARRRRRAAALAHAGLGSWEARDPVSGLALLRGVRASVVVVARGTPGSVGEIAAHCAREGIALGIRGVLGR